MTYPYTWHKGQVRPNELGLFGVNAPHEVTDVWYAIVPVTPRNIKVIVCPDSKLAHIRVLTPPLARDYLQEGPVASDNEQLLFNLLTENLKI